MQRRTFLLQTAALAVAHAAEIDVRRQSWTARWIHPPVPDLQRYGVFHFRRAVEFNSPPAKCLVHVTADSRYQLYVNGRRVVWGPARGDLFHWRYETVDLAPYLQPGRRALLRPQIAQPGGARLNDGVAFVARATPAFR